MVRASLAALSLTLITNLSTHADYTSTPIDLPDSIETNPTGINNNGDIVGYYRTADSRTHGFLLSVDGSIYRFDEPDAESGTFAFGINDGDTIVGQFLAAQGRNMASCC
jgi:probable HAF family extracellular repeat protein